ncbi:MAG: oxygen-dependent coproporphyrinogen oxidase [Oligoflexales bacterium]
MKLTPQQRDQATALYRKTQETLLKGFEQVDGTAKVERRSWKSSEHLKGGGTSGVIRGKVVEKAGANVSEVSGDKYPALEGEHKGKPFFAAGVSTIGHMYNPYAPIGHMNIRVIDVGDQFWVGGGADMTPFKKFEEDTAQFHNAMKKACAVLGGDAYEKYSKWCDEYFYIPHRQSIRGIGGIFFDYLKVDFPQALEFQEAVAEAYVDAYLSILNKRKNTPFTEAEKDEQLYWRGRYVEFNLVYDRGTKFGLMSGGNTEAIFVSLPPVVKW